MRRLLRASAALLFAAIAMPTPAVADATKPRSGSADMGAELRAMQADDAANPGMLWVADGEALWRRPLAPDKRSCADCHGDATASMRGVAARHPAYDARLRRPVDLRQRIEACRAGQGAPPLAPESRDGLALEAYVARQSRGLPLAPPADARLDAAAERGRALYTQRVGQLDLSCAQCHDERAGGRLGGSLVPQGHPNGYPLYRLEWQSLGSLQRRLRNCMTGVRAQPHDYGAPEWIDLEVYLARRAAGLAMEAPAVRP